MVKVIFYCPPITTIIMSNIKSGWYVFSVLYKNETKVLEQVQGYLAKDNYPNKYYLLENKIIQENFSLRNFIQDLGLPRNFNYEKNIVLLPYSDYIFLKINKCTVEEFNDFLTVIKQIPEVKAVIGQIFDIRPNKRIKPAIYKTYPIVLRDKEEKQIRNNNHSFEFNSTRNKIIKLHCPYLLVRNKTKLRVTTKEFITDVVVKVLDKHEREFKVNSNELVEVKGYNYC